MLFSSGNGQFSDIDHQHWKCLYTKYALSTVSIIYMSSSLLFSFFCFLVFYFTVFQIGAAAYSFIFELDMVTTLESLAISWLHHLLNCALFIVLKP